jgi:acyl-CoA dehydrogenase
MSSVDELLGPFTELIKDVTTVDAIRRAEGGGACAAIWLAIEASGFTDALVSEERGGAGLSMAEVHPLVVACGEHLLPQAFGQTILARGLISSSGERAPSEPIVLWPQSPGRELCSLLPPAACEGTLALTQSGATLEIRRLQALAECTDGFGFIPSMLGDGPPLLKLNLSLDLLDYAAASIAASMAGAMARMVEMSVRFANERQQFGRALGAFQTIQHQLSAAAEQVVMATMASRIAFSNKGMAVDPIRAAIAKVIANEAASVVSSVAHAVHGAVGISRDCELQLYSRRLRRWQISFGSTQFWSRRIGSATLGSNQTHSVDFIRGAAGP